MATITAWYNLMVPRYTWGWLKCYYTACDCIFFPKCEQAAWKVATLTSTWRWRNWGVKLKIHTHDSKVYPWPQISLGCPHPTDEQRPQLKPLKEEKWGDCVSVFKYKDWKKNTNIKTEGDQDQHLGPDSRKKKKNRYQTPAQKLTHSSYNK